MAIAKNITVFTLTLSAMLLAPLSHAESVKAYPAILAGHALLPANSYVAAPKDASDNLKVSGKYTVDGVRTEKLASVEGLSAGRPTGISLPFKGQPLQGHSGIKRMADGSYWLLTDNGAGSKANSPDFMLYLNQYDVDFTKGSFKHLRSVFLHDPDKKVPFHIVNEATKQRYLTGADFDPESFQLVGDAFWIGDEFGPYLIKADKAGKVLAVFETKLDGQTLRSPDHFQLKTPGVPTDKVEFEVRRSKGFEGMALSQDGRKLYALLEGPVWDKKQQAYETIAGTQALRVLEFDLKTEAWSGRSWFYPLAQNGLSIGDFNMIDAERGLIIERDDGEGVKEYACEQGQKRPNCFHDLPKIKRVYMVRLNEQNVGQAVTKLGYIDLLNIQDPNKKARKALSEGVFKLPFFTIENVDIVDAEHIVVGNDNNLPFSSSREPNKADDNELVLLKVKDFLQAR